jgi:hypothetical protein
MANKYNAQFTKPPVESPKWNDGASLGTKLETALVRFIQRVITWGYEFFAELMVDIFDQSMKILQPGLDRVLNALLPLMDNNKAFPKEFQAMLNAAKAEKGESAAIIKILLLVTALRSIIFGGLAPLSREISNIADVSIRSNRLDPQMIAQLLVTGYLDAPKANFILTELGLSDTLKDAIIRASNRLPTIGEAMNGLWRGYYSKEDFTNILKKSGYYALDLGLYETLAENIPPFQDVLRLMQREAFQDDVAAKYGYEEDYPAQVEEFFTKLGYDKKWGRLYYRANWTIPSPQMGYEMLHRGIIDKDVLGDMLKIADYPPYWREKLMAMSYSNFTRVDIRRMYQTGVLTEDEVYKAYLELGYNEDKAQKLTAFTKAGNAQTEKDLTRADILGLYHDNLLDRGETGAALGKLGYDNQESEYLLDRIDFNLAKAARVDSIKYVQEKFIAGLIDKTGVTTELTSIGLSQSQIERYTLQWERSIEVKTVLPNKADTTKFFVQDYITQEDFIARLAELGYRKKDIDLYLLMALDAKLQSAETETTNELSPQEPQQPTG